MLKEFKPKPYITPKGFYATLAIMSVIAAIGSFILGYLVFVNIVQLFCFILFAMVWAARHSPSLIISETELVNRNIHTVYWHFPITDYSHLERHDMVTLFFDKQGKSHEMANSNFSDGRWQEIEVALKSLVESK